jgi:integrase
MIFKRCKCGSPEKCNHPYQYDFIIEGRSYRKSTRTANKQLAQRIEDRRRIAVLDGKDNEQSGKPILLSAHVKDYIAFTKTKNATADKDPLVLQKLIDVIGDMPLKNVSPFNIEQWRSVRVREVSRSSVDREQHIIQGCFTLAVRWKRLARSPFADKAVGYYNEKTGRLRVLSDEELARLLRDGDPTVALICRVTLECLPRLSEVLNLHRDHFGPGWIETRRKGGSVGKVTISRDLLQQLRDRIDPTSGLVFPSERHPERPVGVATMSQRIARELRRLGIKGATHHTMRHTGVTLMLEAGRNPRAIQKLAGWQSLRMLERYGHARDAELNLAVTGNAAHLAALQSEATGAATQTIEAVANDRG